jgi:DNA-binding response OmpR family regulator
MSRILVAEDDAALRALYVIWLEHAGFDVVECADGREALAALEGGLAPGAALLDVDMPYVDGLSVCRYLHARDENAPIVVVSGVEDIRSAALAAGAFDVLVKPCGREQLLAALAGAVRVQPAAA